MIDTTSPRTAMCRLERSIRARVSAYNPTTFHFVVNLKDEERKRFIYQMNVKFGSAEPCQCAKCNADTSNGSLEVFK